MGKEMPNRSGYASVPFRCGWGDYPWYLEGYMIRIQEGTLFLIVIYFFFLEIFSTSPNSIIHSGSGVIPKWRTFTSYALMIMWRLFFFGP